MIEGHIQTMGFCQKSWLGKAVLEDFVHKTLKDVSVIFRPINNECTWCGNFFFFKSIQNEKEASQKSAITS